MRLLVVRRSTNQYELYSSEKVRRTDGLPKQQAVLETVHPPVFREPLVEAADRCEEDDRVDIVKVGVPCVPLSVCETSRSAHPQGYLAAGRTSERAPPTS